MVHTKRQGFGLHTQKLSFLSAAFLVFSLKAQVYFLLFTYWCMKFFLWMMWKQLAADLTYDKHEPFFSYLDFEKIQREEALDLPPMPPHGRNWKGSVVAPFAGNNMLVLYQCPRKTSDNSKTSGGQNNSYFIQVLHNEIPVSMPVRQLPFYFICVLFIYCSFP